MTKRLTTKKYKTLKKLIIIYLAIAIAMPLLSELILGTSTISIGLFMIGLYLLVSGYVSLRYGIYLQSRQYLDRRRSFNFYSEPGARSKAIGIAQIVAGLATLYAAYGFL